MEQSRFSYDLSPLAESDLDEIINYIAMELSAPQAASRLIDNIQSAVERICDHPFSCPLLKDKILREKGYRLLIVQNFNIFYLVKDQTIVVRRILYGRRNYERLL